MHWQKGLKPAALRWAGAFNFCPGLKTDMKPCQSALIFLPGAQNGAAKQGFSPGWRKK